MEPIRVLHQYKSALSNKSQLDQLLDLKKDSPEPADGKVIGWADHKIPLDKKTEFRITVQELKEKATSSGSDGVKEDGSRAEL